MKEVEVAVYSLPKLKGKSSTGLYFSYANDVSFLSSVIAPTQVCVCLQSSKTFLPSEGFLFFLSKLETFVYIMSLFLSFTFGYVNILLDQLL